MKTSFSSVQGGEAVFWPSSALTGHSLRLFIFEAVLLSFIGAVVGILLASLTGAIINLAMNKLAENRGIYQHFDLFSTPLWLILSLILFMILVGLIVVFLPARHAERINPIDALRRE